MSKVTDSIGFKFERFVKEKFPELISIQPNQNIPDFYNSQLNFWVEAKIGNILWGPRIKEQQINDFIEVEEPVIYALGFHNFDDAHKKLIQKTENGRQKYLDKNMNILNVYLISNNLIRKIWEKESRISQKEAVSYCMVKKGIINNLIQNRSFKRNNEIIASAENFYNYSENDFLIRDNFFYDNINYGLILEKKNPAMINYLEKRIMTPMGFEPTTPRLRV